MPPAVGRFSREPSPHHSGRGVSESGRQLVGPSAIRRRVPEGPRRIADGSVVRREQRPVRLAEGEGRLVKSGLAEPVESTKDGLARNEVLGMLTATTVLAMVVLMALVAQAWQRRRGLVLGLVPLAALGLWSCQEESQKSLPLLRGSITTLTEADTILLSEGATGTLSEAVSASGEVKGSFGAHAYGSTRFDTSSEGRKFAGTPRDDGVGVDMMGARAYVPELGVFASVDPLRLSAPERLLTAHPSASAYAYANNNPLTQVDREGEFAWVAAAAVLVGVIVTTQYANAPESAEAPTCHKGWGEQLLDMAHNSVMAYGGMRLVGAAPALTRTVAAGDVGTALQTTTTVVKAGATAEIAGPAADKVDPSGTTRKVVETVGGLAMKSAVSPRAPTRVGREVVVGGEAAEARFAEGSFSISNWSGYPAGMPRPPGPVRILTGEEYAAARALANQTNAGIRAANSLAGSGLQIHEIQPVKFGGSPTDTANKILLPAAEHVGPDGVHAQFWTPLLRWAGDGG